MSPAVVSALLGCEQGLKTSVGISKARVSANYIFRLRRQLLESSRQSQTRPRSDGTGGGAAVACEELQFAYPRRPHLRVLDGVTAEVSLDDNYKFSREKSTGR